MFIYLYVYYNLPNGCQDPIEIGRCDIQVSKSNLGYVQFVHTPLFKCSDWKKPKKALPQAAILFPSKGMHIFLTLPHQRNVNDFNMAY